MSFIDSKIPMPRKPQTIYRRVVRDIPSVIDSANDVNSVMKDVSSLHTHAVKMQRRNPENRKEVFACVYGFSDLQKRNVVMDVLRYITLSECVYGSITRPADNGDGGGWEVLISILQTHELNTLHIDKLENVLERLAVSAGIVPFESYMCSAMQTCLTRLKRGTQEYGSKHACKTMTGANVFQDFNDCREREKEARARAELESGTGFPFTATSMLRYVQMASSRIASLENFVLHAAQEVRSVTPVVQDAVNSADNLEHRFRERERNQPDHLSGFFPGRDLSLSDMARAHSADLWTLDRHMLSMRQELFEAARDVSIAEGLRNDDAFSSIPVMNPANNRNAPLMRYLSRRELSMRQGMGLP